ncbi:hypothetical protein ZWY2020_016852 [Hordeum vulgare]|nr:hypothetical protein ZWY2020_016852 [Hordeum vulgare]
MFPQDYICTNEDISIIQYIMSVPPKTKLVGIFDAVLSVEDLAGLINGDAFLDDSVINAYIYCMCAQEHLRHRARGNVHLETTYVSAILKRDGNLDIAPSNMDTSYDGFIVIYNMTWFIFQ